MSDDIEELKRQLSNARFELQMLEYTRLKDNEYLLSKVDAKDKALREVLRAPMTHEDECPYGEGHPIHACDCHVRKYLPLVDEEPQTSKESKKVGPNCDCEQNDKNCVNCWGF